MNKCTRQKKFLFWKWTVDDHTFLREPRRKNDCTTRLVCSVCGYEEEMRATHDFYYNSIRQIGAKRKCKRCGIEQILYEFEKDDGVEREEWANYMNLK